MSTVSGTTTGTTTAGTTVIAAIPGRPFGLVRHSLVMARRSLIKTMRKPELLLGFGSLLAFRFETGPLEVLGACLLVMFLAFCFSWMFVLLGMVVREPGAVQGLGFVIMFPLTFGTNVLVPTDTLPGWLQAWVKINPVADAMQAARGLMVGTGPVAGPVIKTLIWSCAILLVFSPL